MEQKKRIQVKLIQSATVLAGGIGILLFIVSFFHIKTLDNIFANYQAISRYTQRLIAVVVLILTIYLAKRRRLAWLGVVMLLFISLFAHFVLHHTIFGILIVVVEIYILTILLIFHPYFNRKGKRLTLSQTFALLGVLLIAIVVNAIFELSTLSGIGKSGPSLVSGIVAFGKILLDGGTGNQEHSVFETFLNLLFWAAIIGGLLVVLRTATQQRSLTQMEMNKARNLVKLYGQNPGSYLTLEDDKLLFFGTVTEGVIAYGIVGDVIVVNGDPVCAKENIDGMLTEFKLFCISGGYQCVFLSTTSTFLEDYTAHGYHHVKCGEEARFALNELTLAGGKMAKLRANVNHANKAGLTTFEYEVSVQKDTRIEKEIEEVSNSWLSEKKSGELAFTIGGVGLDNPMERRYFYLRNPEGKMVAFNVYVPFAGMDGYMADVTRRINEAPGGATEKLIVDAFMQFKEEGIHWGSMGLAPLSNVHEDGVEDSATTKILELIYNKFNSFYGFKDLRLAKERYSPTSWEPGFFVYSTATITPQMVYAIIKIQNPGGLWDYLKSFFENRFHDSK